MGCLPSAAVAPTNHPSSVADGLSVNVDSSLSGTIRRDPVNPVEKEAGMTVDDPHHPTQCPAISYIHHFWCSCRNDALRVVGKEGSTVEVLGPPSALMSQANLPTGGLARWRLLISILLWPSWIPSLPVAQAGLPSEPSHRALRLLLEAARPPSRLGAFLAAPDGCSAGG